MKISDKIINLLTKDSLSWKHTFGGARHSSGLELEIDTVFASNIKIVDPVYHRFNWFEALKISRALKICKENILNDSIEKKAIEQVQKDLKTAVEFRSNAQNRAIELLITFPESPARIRGVFPESSSTEELKAVLKQLLTDIESWSRKKAEVSALMKTWIAEEQI